MAAAPSARSRRAFVFEAAGYSILGPTAIHCASPDEGNIHLLDVVARPDQRAHFLKPLAEGKIRSCFAMTEPGGAGSDPGMLQATARLDGNQWVINGRKWLITGAEGAGFVIIMAKVEGGPQDGHATLFLADLPDPAIRIERTLDTIDSSFTGGHAVLEIKDLRLPADCRAGRGRQGLPLRPGAAGPGAAQPLHALAGLGGARAGDRRRLCAHPRRPSARPLGEHEGVSFMLADNHMDIHQARLSILHTAWLLDKGERASNESSMSKVVCSEAIARVADRSMQILGGMGMTRDTVVERIFRDTRAFRIYDGPSEVHRWALGARIVSGKM